MMALPGSWLPARGRWPSPKIGLFAGFSTGKPENFGLSGKHSYIYNSIAAIPPISAPKEKPRMKSKTAPYTGHRNPAGTPSDSRMGVGDSRPANDRTTNDRRANRTEGWRPARLLLLPIGLLFVLCVQARRPWPIGFAYYDLDHLHDTVPALFYDDSGYTPDGRLRWTTARYEQKIRAAAAVLDSMRMPVVALWSVENEGVVRDLTAACDEAYSYLHRTLNTLDGMDFALLYHGDRFFPSYDETGRRYLYVEGLLRRDDGTRETVGLVLCSDTQMAAWIVGDLREERPGVRLMVMGRTETLDAARYGLQDATARAATAGRGNVRARGGWRMRDRILIDTALTPVRGDVFARSSLLDPATGYPLPTYDRRHYTGSISYALPVFVYLR